MAIDGGGDPKKDRSYRGQAEASLRRAQKALKAGGGEDLEIAQIYFKQAEVLAILALTDALTGQRADEDG